MKTFCCQRCGKECDRKTDIGERLSTGAARYCVACAAAVSRGIANRKSGGKRLSDGRQRAKAYRRGTGLRWE